MLQLLSRIILMAVLSGAMTLTSAQSFAQSVPSLPPGGSLGLALDIPTVPNLRDVGGYKTRDGATVARGLAYRSDTFNPLSADDIKSGRVGKFFVPTRND
jgi:protein-tyrosine phosphatase